MKSVDLFVIGGGSGGVRAARVAAGHGARVALAESDRLGGTCVIRGCVPKKLMVLASRFAQAFDEAPGFGWQLPAAPRFDWAEMQRRVGAEVTRLEGAYRATLDSAGVELHGERALIEDAHTVRLAVSGQRFRARHILVATGARPEAGPPIPGAELAASSNEVFEWPAQPRRVVVQGAGYIALEFACLLRRLGSEVTVVLRGERVLRGFDDELREHLQAQLEAQGLRFLPGRTLTAIERTSEALVAQLDDGQRLAAVAVLRALGRRPNSGGLGLEAAGIALGADGAVPVDRGGTTCVPSVHAVGDVTDRVQLTPAAIREGQAWADRVFGGIEHMLLTHLGPDGLVPSAVFTSPEVGSVGLSEAQALERHAEIDIYRTDFRPIKATLAGGSERAWMKLVVQRASGRVLGVHLVGAEAAELIQLAAVALTLGATKADLDATLAVHPTAAEELVTMRSPARRHGR
jgi:glutathione reductase (NADPH)